MVNAKAKDTWALGTRLLICILNNKRDGRNKNKQKQKAGIVTSLNDTTLIKVTYGKYTTRFPDEVAYEIYVWFGSQ